MNEKQILERSISEHQSAIDKAKSELAALDKPELRHGDYGYGAIAGDAFIVNGNYLNAEMLTVYNRPLFQNPKDGHWHRILPLGNIFDDLASLAEPLEEFEVRDGNAYHLVMKLLLEGRMKDTIYVQLLSSGGSTKEYFHMDIGRATKIHRKLGQLLATAKRKAAKK